jgi:hypothetical protein
VPPIVAAATPVYTAAAVTDADPPMVQAAEYVPVAPAVTVAAPAMLAEPHGNGLSGLGPLITLPVSDGYTVEMNVEYVENENVVPVRVL